MNNHHSSSPLLSSWAYYCQGKSMEELRQSLLYTTVELEQTRAAVQEELRKRDDQISHLKDLLQKAIRERDEAQGKCHRLLLEKLLLQQTQQQQHQQTQQNQQTAPLSGISSIEDEPRRGIDSNNGFSSSDCEESIVSSPVIDPIQQTQQLPPGPSLPHPSVELLPEKPLPEKGKLLQAVMKAGPLLQTLLLAGPLPQWRHPPPPLESFEIPPVTIPSPPPQPPSHTQLQHQDSLANVSCGIVNRKRVLCEGSASPPETKFQRVALR
ncbi:enabled-like protein [Pyrus ussuriensis x Pyrus communis]|uniref:Enabled-like protein n=1 Tax=Pyrus ussuriensis x Pyrus communis TaxID=2448454 RepID=A0A5N5FYK8_9ROSA|nr:enabled-like protein [Pyrus ussuriensis x Pyrus communis]